MPSHRSQIEISGLEIPDWKAQVGFAAKVMCHFGYGFAAGCEAVAPPRRNWPDYSGGYAPRVGLPLD